MGYAAYSFDDKKILEESKGRPVRLKFRGGNEHVLYPNGQHVNPEKQRGGKDARRERIRLRHQSAAKANEAAPAIAPT